MSRNLSKVFLGLTLFTSGNPTQSEMDQVHLAPEVSRGHESARSGAEPESSSDNKEIDAPLNHKKSSVRKEVSTALSEEAQKSIDSHEKKCGGDNAEVCRDLQEEVYKELMNARLGTWVYEEDITWAYDEDDGSEIDAIAFPGYQQYFPCNDGMDVISIGVYPPSKARPSGAFFYGISHHSEPLSQSSWSNAYSDPELMVEGLKEILVKEEQ